MQGGEVLFEIAMQCKYYAYKAVFSGCRYNKTVALLFISQEPSGTKL